MLVLQMEVGRTRRDLVNICRIFNIVRITLFGICILRI
jgi:hypothetical protein